jgi:uncharacterized membrane protein YdjX (TVP38/TMEM64 family)
MGEESQMTIVTTAAPPTTTTGGHPTATGTPPGLGPEHTSRQRAPIPTAAQPESPTGSGRHAVWLMQLALVLVPAALLGLLYAVSEGFRTEAGHAVAALSAGDMTALRDYILSFGVWAPVVSLLLMVAQALIAPVPASLVTFANGLAFGVVWGSLLSVAGQTLAAAVCFWIARGIGRRPAEVLVGSAGLAAADRWFARRGGYAILLARLVPGMAFDAVSYAAGLTRIGFGRFIAATAAGIVPQTILYAYLGDQAPEYVWVLPLLGAIALGSVLVMVLLGRRRGAEPDPRERTGGSA